MVWSAVAGARCTKDATDARHLPPPFQTSPVIRPLVTLLASELLRALPSSTPLHLQPFHHSSPSRPPRRHLVIFSSCLSFLSRSSSALVTPSELPSHSLGTSIFDRQILTLLRALLPPFSRICRLRSANPAFSNLPFSFLPASEPFTSHLHHVLILDFRPDLFGLYFAFAIIYTPLVTIRPELGNSCSFINL